MANYEIDRGPQAFDENVLRTSPYTTENMTGYFDDLQLEGKEIAAVCGSNDFALNAFAHGAASVDAVDPMISACFDFFLCFDKPAFEKLQFLWYRLVYA